MCVIPQGLVGPRSNPAEAMSEATKQNPVTVAQCKPPASQQLFTIAAQNPHLRVSFPRLGATLFLKHSCIYVSVCACVCSGMHTSSHACECQRSVSCAVPQENFALERESPMGLGLSS